MNNEPLTYTEVDGKDLKRLSTKFQEMFKDEPLDLTVIACIAWTLVVHCPTITQAQLVEGIRQVSEYVYLLSTSMDQPIEKGKAN